MNNIYRTNIIPFCLHSPISLFKCKDIINFTNAQIEKSIICTVEERMGKIFGDGITIFKNLLSSTHAVITGSFILQCILNEKWKNSDIDISEKFQIV